MPPFNSVFYVNDLKIKGIISSYVCVFFSPVKISQVILQQTKVVIFTCFANAGLILSQTACTCMSIADQTIQAEKNQSESQCFKVLNPVKKVLYMLQYNVLWCLTIYRPIYVIRNCSFLRDLSKTNNQLNKQQSYCNHTCICSCSPALVGLLERKTAESL